MTLFSDVTFSTEGIVIITGLLSALAGAVVFIFRLLIKAKDDTVALLTEQKKVRDEENQKKSYQEIAEEAVAIAESRVNRKREADGHGPTKKIAPVVPEHNSPVTREQQEAADLQTLRARVTAAALALHLPAREAGPPETPPAGSIGELTGRTRAAGAESLRDDIAEVKADVAEVKADVAETPDRTAEKISHLIPKPGASEEKSE